ncbi:MAG TPA: hypothetical protein VMT34_02180 [Aggregatilineales bacterium]|nr:hypothetical protein [Aggregatilineales bacterium]
MDDLGFTGSQAYALNVNPATITIIPWNADAAQMIGLYRTSVSLFMLKNTNSGGNPDVYAANGADLRTGKALTPNLLAVAVRYPRRQLLRFLAPAGAILPAATPA